MKDITPPTFYVVATPIGNLEDITLRAVRILKEVDTILCEDTRVTKKLLSHYGIHTATQSYHSNNALSKLDSVISQIKEGKTLALVSDAGTPTISDPGSLLVSTLRKEIPGIAIMTIPGANAAVSALSISGFPASEFLFLGFLPHKKGRESFFREIAASKRTVVFYESTHRLMKTLASLELHIENETPQRRIAVFAELTKLFERSSIGIPSEVITYFTEDPKRQKGEFVVMVEGVR